jgi:signal transduction histidine kinase
MLRASLRGLDRKGLRLWLGLFFLALAVPTGILIRHAYSQLKWEAFHHHRVLAEELASRIDDRLIRLINDEEVRSFGDYTFLVVAGDPSANFLQRSPLSTYPVTSAVPGLIGYFQVDADGVFSTPLLPQGGAKPRAYGVAGDELEQRLILQSRIRQVLADNRLVHGGKLDADRFLATPAIAAQPSDKRLAPSSKLSASAEGRLESSSLEDSGAAPTEEEVLGQAAFDRLDEASRLRGQGKQQAVAGALGRVEDLKLESRYAAAPSGRPPRQGVSPSVELQQRRSARKERGALPVAPAPMRYEAGEADASEPSRVVIRTFESEIDPFELSLLDSGHFVLFRKVWRDGQRYIQGALIEQHPFLEGLIASAFRETALSRMSKLIVAYQGHVLSAFSGEPSERYASGAGELGGALLYKTRLSPPAGGLELIFGITGLPSGPGRTVVNWMAVILMVVLVGGFYLMYRLGVEQIELARQQRDFVSAVSHELKTPLTSIRMYGEMLREGWASEEKKKTYYDYIHDESERLSRLIANVLQLARMTRNDLRLDLKPMRVAELTDGIRDKVGSQVERAGFELSLRCEDEARAAVIEVDADAFAQIFINLVDNAIKFSARAQVRSIDIGCRLDRHGSVVFTVRDYGPGVPRDQIRKIFRLFYRSENELTRESVGTGIGLALVRQLVRAMHGQVDVANQEPGAEFSVAFAAADKA